MKFFKNQLLLSAAIFAISCAKTAPEEIKIGKDHCDHCAMIITNPKYATEILTEKGKLYKFDDIRCMNEFEEYNPDKVINAKKYVVDFPSGNFIEQNNATLITGGKIESPMGGNTQAFQDSKVATQQAETLDASVSK